MPIFLEIVKVLQDIAGRVTKEHGKARIRTYLGEYQDSKHLHFHISSGDKMK